MGLIPIWYTNLKNRKEQLWKKFMLQQHFWKNIELPDEATSEDIQREIDIWLYEDLLLSESDINEVEYDERIIKWWIKRKLMR